MSTTGPSKGLDVTTKIHLGAHYSELSQQTKRGTSQSVSDILDRFEVVETRSCTILLSGKGLGLSLGTDEARQVIVVKNIGRGGAIEKDGRIRVGDQIIAINGKSMEGTTVQKARYAPVCGDFLMYCNPGETFTYIRTYVCVYAL